MYEFNQDSNGPTLNGFDNADSNSNSGYTVNSNNGYYTKNKSDIIQDEVYQASENSQINHETFKNKEYKYNNPNNFKPKKEKKGHSTAVVIVACVLAVLVSITTTLAVVKLSPKEQTIQIPQNEFSGANININIDETAQTVVEAVAKKVTPSVVGIRTTTSVASFFGGNNEASGEGSGVIYSSDGYIITNYHVIADAVSNSGGSKIEVFLDDLSSDSYTASVVGYNISADLAVIKINVNGLTPIEFSDSDQMKVGQYVITVGNPGGLEFMDSVTYGVISGLNREVSSDSGIKLIQTDAAINPGNSGGALVNVKGELVGINSAKIVSEEFEGMGFAIPSNTTKRICDKIIERQNSPEPYVGITLSERYTAEVLKYYGYPTGAVVLSVADNSPADKAGIERGDIIIEFNSKSISEYKLLGQYINECSPGDKVKVKIYRGGRYYTTTITIGSNN